MSNKKNIEIPQLDPKVSKKVMKMTERQKEINNRLPVIEAEIKAANQALNIVNGTINANQQVADVVGTEDAKQQLELSKKNLEVIKKKLSKLNSEKEKLESESNEIDDSKDSVLRNAQIKHFIELNLKYWELLDENYHKGSTNEEALEEIRKTLLNSPYCAELSRVSNLRSGYPAKYLVKV